MGICYRKSKKRKDKAPRLTNPQDYQFKEAILFILYVLYIFFFLWLTSLYCIHVRSWTAFSTLWRRGKFHFNEFRMPCRSLSWLWTRSLDMLVRR